VVGVAERRAGVGHHLGVVDEHRAITLLDGDQPAVSMLMFASAVYAATS
jgi:hypothetical protein